MSAEPRSIVIEDPPEVELTLPAIGRVTMRAARRRVEREVAWRTRRPLATDYRGFATAVLAASLRPRQPASVISGLPERDRRQLMLAAVRLRDEERAWRMLYGTSLSQDERFFAVMLWS